MLLAMASPIIADVLEPLPAVPQDSFGKETDMKASESDNLAPVALRLASPERSSVDEEHYNVSMSCKDWIENSLPRWQHRI